MKTQYGTPRRLAPYFKFLVVTLGFTILFFLITAFWLLSIGMTLLGYALFRNIILSGVLGSIFVAVLAFKIGGKHKQTLFSIALALLISSIAIIFFLSYTSQYNAIWPPTSCFTNSTAYYCSAPVYIHNSTGAGTLMISVGQDTGTNWGNAIVMFAIQGTAMGSDGPIVTTSATNTVNGGLVSGESVSVILSSNSTAKPQTSPVGSLLSGSLWACYVTSATTLTYAPGTGTCTAGIGAVHYVEMAVLYANAV